MSSFEVNRQPLEVHVRSLFFGTIAAGALTFAAFGCAGSTHVDQSWLARVPPDQLGSVNESRSAELQARDQVTRAQVAQQDARRDLDTAQREESAAHAEVAARQSALKGATERAQAEGITQANNGLNAANIRLAAARAQVDFRREQVRAADAQRRLADRQMDLAEAQVNYAEYLAVRSSGDVRVQKLKEDAFRDRVNADTQKVNAARQEADNRSRQAEVARFRWEQLRNQLQGYGGGGSSGTNPAATGTR